MEPKAIIIVFLVFIALAMIGGVVYVAVKKEGLTNNDSPNWSRGYSTTPVFNTYVTGAVGKPQGV